MSEFEVPVQLNGLPKEKGSDSLTAAEKLHLVYRTGSENVNAEPYDGAFQGTTPETHT